VEGGSVVQKKGKEKRPLGSRASWLKIKVQQRFERGKEERKIKGRSPKKFMSSAEPLFGREKKKGGGNLPTSSGKREGKDSRFEEKGGSMRLIM